MVEDTAKVEKKSKEVLEIISKLEDIVNRLDKIEKAVYKPNDKPVMPNPKKNYNTDPGPFLKGSGLNDVK